MKRVILLTGKARTVFRLLNLMAKYKNKTLKELLDENTRL